MEVQYDLYNPTIIKLEVLKLEKRLDDELFYLRDAPQEYSTVPFDMEPLVLPPGVSVPVNTMKVSASICARYKYTTYCPRTSLHKNWLDRYIW